MNMIRYKDLSIPEPCTFLNTSKESKVDNAYFCSQCDKKVYDFRNKKESYLNEIHAQTNGNFCGVYYEDQIRVHIPTLSSPNFFQRLKQYSVLYLTTAFSFIQQHSWASEEKITPPTIQVDQDSTQKFYVMTKEKDKYLSRFEVIIYINHKFYQVSRVEDSATIWLPDSIKVGDKITLKAKSYRGGLMKCQFGLHFYKRSHLHKKTFIYKGGDWVNLNVSQRLNFSFRRRAIRSGRIR